MTVCPSVGQSVGRSVTHLVLLHFGTFDDILRHFKKVFVFLWVNESFLESEFSRVFESFRVFESLRVYESFRKFSHFV